MLVRPNLGLSDAAFGYVREQVARYEEEEEKDPRPPLVLAVGRSDWGPHDNKGGLDWPACTDKAVPTSPARP